MAKDSFIFYRSFYEAIKSLKEKDRVKIYDAICEKSLNDNELTLVGISNSMFTLIKPQIEANNQKYENGKKGGRPKKNQSETSGFENNIENKKPKQNQNKTTGFEKTQKSKNQNETEAKANVNEECIMKMNNENVNAECKMIVQCYEENIGILAPASAELLLSYLDDLKADMIVQAIKIATQRNKRSARYIQGILADWIRKGYKNLADIENEQLSRSQDKSSVSEEEQIQKDIEMLKKFAEEEMEDDY